MKNLLVDVLRQAGTENNAPAEEPRGEPPLDATTRDSDAPDGGLKLAETLIPQASLDGERNTEPPPAPISQAPALAEPTLLSEPTSLGEPNLLEQPGTVDVETQQPNDFGLESVVEDPTMLVPALTEPPAPTTVPKVASDLTRIEPGLERTLLIGRWSPLLCLLVLSTATAALTYMHNLSAQRMAVDLGARGAELDTARDIDTAANGWWRLHETNDRAGTAPTPRAIERTMAPVPALPSQPPLVNVSSPGDPAFARVEEGYAAYLRGDLDAAEDHYEAALAINPRHVHALKGYAAVLQRSSRAATAISVYERILEVDPNDTDAVAAIATLAAGDDRATVASRLKLLLQRNPDAAAVHFAIGVEMARSRPLAGSPQRVSQCT